MTNNICCNDNRRNVNDGAASHTLLPNMNGKEIFDRIEDLIDLEVFWRKAKHQHMLLVHAQHTHTNTHAHTQWHVLLHSFIECYQI
jgi:Fe-S cluster biosynthesis and repair protein YggX